MKSILRSGMSSSNRQAPDGQVTPKKSVTFFSLDDQKDSTDVPIEIIATLLPSSSMTPAQRQALYVQPLEYELFQGTARLISAEIRRRAVVAGSDDVPSLDCSYESVMTRCFDCCSRLARVHDDKRENFPSEKSQRDDDERGNEASVILPMDLFVPLTNWVQVGHSRRGLERWSIPSHSNIRSLGREIALRSVLEAQRLLKKQHEAHEEAGKQAALIRDVSERCSRSARLFALALGQADAAAVGNFFLHSPLTQESLIPQSEAIAGTENVEHKAEQSANVPAAIFFPTIEASKSIQAKRAPRSTGYHKAVVPLSGPLEVSLKSSSVSQNQHTTTTLDKWSPVKKIIMEQPQFVQKIKSLAPLSPPLCPPYFAADRQKADRNNPSLASLAA